MWGGGESSPPPQIGFLNEFFKFCFYSGLDLGGSKYSKVTNLFFPGDPGGQWTYLSGK